MGILSNSIRSFFPFGMTNLAQFTTTMRKIKTIFIIFVLSSLFLRLLPVLANEPDKYGPFNEKEYNKDEFDVSGVYLHHGNVTIEVRDVKKKNEHAKGTVHYCRAWFIVKKDNKDIDQKYYADIEPLGFSYGIIVPQIQPPAPYFAAVKNGDYDGRLFLVNYKNGKVMDLMGGFYLITKDKRYLFSEYASDGINGLEIVDLNKGIVIYSTEKLPCEIMGWYEKDGKYIFTAPIGTPTEKVPPDGTLLVYSVDFHTYTFKEEFITEAELNSYKRLSYDYDPTKQEDCRVIYVEAGAVK